MFVILITRYELSGGMAINDDRWHHIAIIWDGQTGRVAMYLGGVLKASGKDLLLTGEIAGQGLLVISSNATGGLFLRFFPMIFCLKRSVLCNTP